MSVQIPFLQTSFAQANENNTKKNHFLPDWFPTEVHKTLLYFVFFIDFLKIHFKIGIVSFESILTVLAIKKCTLLVYPNLHSTQKGFL